MRRVYLYVLFPTLFYLGNLTAQPLPPMPVPPNASRVTATIQNCSVWPPGSLHAINPPVPSDQTLYSLQLEIQTSEPEHSALESLAVPKTTYQVFTYKLLQPDLVGKEIEAVIKLTGNTDGVRWFISDIHVIR